MYRAGIYIETPATEFLEWLEAWTRRNAATESAWNRGHITVGTVQRRMLLSQHLVVEVVGTLRSAHAPPEVKLLSVSFHVLPVGLGHSVQVVGITYDQELFPLLVGFVSAAGARWPDAATTAWFGEPPCHPRELCALNIPIAILTLERALAGFAESFTTLSIRSVSFSPQAGITSATTRDRASRHVQWTFRLSLPTSTSYQGIDHINLACNIARTGAKRPLTLTLTRHGFPYKEIEPFTAGLIGFCQLNWPDTRVSGPPNHPLELPTSVAARAHLAVAKRPWELIADNAWDRQLIELWWQDYPCAIIARRVGVTSKTVINRLSQLRQLYGKDIIPTDSQRRGGGREKSGRPG